MTAAAEWLVAAAQMPPIHSRPTSNLDAVASALLYRVTP